MPTQDKPSPSCPYSLLTESSSSILGSVMIIRNNEDIVVYYVGVNVNYEIYIDKDSRRREGKRIREF